MQVRNNEFYYAKGFGAVLATVSGKGARRKVELLPVSPNVRTPQQKRALKNLDEASLSELPTVEAIHNGLKRSVDSDLPSPSRLSIPAAHKLIESNDPQEIGRGMKYTLALMKKTPSLQGMVAAPIEFFATVLLVRDAEEKDELGKLKGLVKRNQRGRKLQDAMNPFYQTLMEMREQVKAEFAAAKAEASQPAKLEPEAPIDPAPPAGEQRPETPVAKADPEPTAKVAEAKPEEAPQDVSELVEKQIEIVKSAVEKARGTLGIINDHATAVERLGELFEQGKTSFDDTVILLRHAFTNQNEVDANDTIQILKDNGGREFASVGELASAFNPTKKRIKKRFENATSDADKALHSKVFEWRPPKLTA